MELRHFKVAAARLFFDMINVDGVIEDNEILLLEGLGDYAPVDINGYPIDLPNFSKEANEIIHSGGLRKKYKIECSDIQEAIRITTSDAIMILKRWQDEKEEELLKYDSKTVFLAENIKKDLMTISSCDGSRDLSEARFIAALGLCLNNRLSPEYRAIPISYRERNLRFAKKEIIYLESEYDEKINEDIKKNKLHIENLLTIYGYDFVYIPDVVTFLRNKAKSGLLTPILMFSKPFYYKDKDKTNEFADRIQGITTSDFTNTFSLAAHLSETLPPCLLIKIKTSTVEFVKEDGKMCRTKYTDFIALPVNDSVFESVRRLPDNILEYTDCVTSLISRTSGDKLYCKGIHKTLIDYTVHKYSTNIVRKVIINLRGKVKYVDFVGIDGGKIAMKPKELSLYLLFILCSAYGKGVCKNETNISELNRVARIFAQIYRLSSDLKDSDPFKSLSVHKSNIKAKINSIINLEDKSSYNIDETDDFVRVNLNPEIVFIRDEYTDMEIPLDSWVYERAVL